MLFCTVERTALLRILKPRKGCKRPGTGALAASVVGVSFRVTTVGRHPPGMLLSGRLGQNSRGKRLHQDGNRISAFNPLNF